MITRFQRQRGIQRADTINRSSGSTPQEFTAAQLSGHHWSLTRQRRRLVDMSIVFRDDAQLNEVQCDEAIKRLGAIRRATLCTKEFLCGLDTEMTQTFKPYGCIEALNALDYQTTRAILHLGEFAPVCQSISNERVELHLFLRSFLPCVITSFDATTRQLAILLDPERQAAAQRQQQQEREGVRA
jgi:hypothetical protein